MPARPISNRAVDSTRITSAPSVPSQAVQCGTDKIQPTGQVFPTFKRGEVTIKFGTPISVDKWQDAELTSTAAREITDTVMAAIQTLTGQEYMPRYAPKRGVDS